jgi:hypothetical protein
MQNLPIELQNMICSYIGKTPSANAFNQLIDCKETYAECRTEMHLECPDDFNEWWNGVFKKCNYAMPYNSYKWLAMNPQKFLATAGMGDPCCRCGWNRTWSEMQTEGYDNHCYQCYAKVYHNDDDFSGCYDVSESEPESDNDEYEDYEDDN